MPDLHIADVIVVVVYLVSITAIGVWLMKKIHTTTDFFMPRRFGKSMLIMHAFGTGSHSDQAVTVASKTYTNGLSGIWYQWIWLFVTPFYWLIPAVFRRFRAITTSDLYELRYDRSVAILFAIVGTASLSFNMGMMLKASSAIITASTGIQNPNMIIAAMTVLFVVYGMAGGMAAAIITDFIQGILTIFSHFFCCPSFSMPPVVCRVSERRSITLRCFRW